MPIPLEFQWLDARLGMGEANGGPKLENQKMVIRCFKDLLQLFQLVSKKLTTSIEIV